MYLKSIQIHGFKSFANKIVFEFKDGITGIVGPNGSGKSNVADAVRWVLGEQSAKQLRGAKMEDVIFSGTETKKPLGFAYVAITLDNSDNKLPIDFKEVIVARRVYGSGESEYLINGNNCRLKDVQELFLDTGIGKEGYSIIGQGQIDKILSSKPEDRRELFDEAAGIVKYKKRKQVAQKNLESEKLNLSRIKDILNEIEKQVVPLEKQSFVAREYLKYKEELKTLDVNMFLMEYAKTEEIKNQLEEKIQIAENDLKITQDKYEDTKSEYEKLEKIIEEYNVEIEDNNTNLNIAKLEIEKFEGEIKVLNEQIYGTKERDEHFKSRLEVINTEIEERQKEQEKLTQEKNSIDTKLQSLDEIQKETSVQMDEISLKIAEYTNEIDKLHKAIYEVLNENSSIKTKLQRYEMILEQNNIKKTEINQKLIKVKSDDVIQEDSINGFKLELSHLIAKIESTTELNRNLESMINGTQNKIVNIESKINVEQQEYHQEKSRLNTLKNITERYEGYGNSIRKVMEQKDKKPGIIGVVADIIKVNKEYELAVEIALGGSISNIVTTNSETAKDLISFLKTNKYGRATFLPLTNITNKNSFYNEKALLEKGVVGLANSLIETDNKYESLIEYLLGRIVVVDNIDNAITLSKKYNYSLRIVTVEGELLSPGGSMSGGAFKNTSNLLSRRREIESINKNIELLELKIKELKEKLDLEKRYKSDNQIAIDLNKEKIQGFYLTQNTIKMQLDQITSKKDENLEFYNLASSESQEIDIQSKDLQENIISLNSLLELNEEICERNQNKIDEYNKDLDQEKIVQRSFNEKDASLKIDLSSIHQTKNFIETNVTRIKSEIKKFFEELNELNENRKKASNQIGNNIDQIKNKENDIVINKKLQSKLDETICMLKLEKDQISRSHKGFFDKREELSNRKNDLDKEIFRIVSQKEKHEERLNNQINYMWEEYEITYNNALILRNLEYENFTELKKESLKLKSKIKDLGDVNVNSIEDYKSLTERYEHLKSQHDDLVNAEQVLHHIIIELDNEMRKQFEEKFRDINIQFNVVFKELFGGGNGTLELVAGEDILEAGIRIIAQPPGKKLQNMMQLSGGEKALTAISILFAIQNLKPSPFCLLDEIEAALDDSNVKRFAKYLHKLTKETQFIIITHRRGTMAVADVLYGVTMQEKGVSTLVSVNLIENQLDK